MLYSLQKRIYKRLKINKYYDFFKPFSSSAVITIIIIIIIMIINIIIIIILF